MRVILPAYYAGKIWTRNSSLFGKNVRKCVSAEWADGGHFAHMM